LEKLKKVSFALNICLLGSLDSGKEVFMDYLKSSALEMSFINDVGKMIDYHEMLIVYNEIPIKIRIFLSDNLEKVIDYYDKIKNIDVVILSLNLYDVKSLDEYNVEKIKELKENLMLRGVLTLVGLDVKKIFNKPAFFTSSKISNQDLIRKAKELEVLYCFKIENKKDDLLQFYDQILNDFIFKFQYSSPELFNQAKSYGNKLSIKRNN